MALAAPITISQQLSMIESWMQQWAQPLGGTASKVSNLRELWNQASLNSQVPRILICYAGERARGSFSEVAAWHRVDRDWSIAVTQGRGYYSNRGDNLTGANGSTIAFTDVLEQVRDRFRCMLGISEELPSIDYRDTKPMQLGNLVVDGYIISASTANDIPAIGTTPSTPA